MAVKDEIEAKLRAAFSPRQLDVINESHRHAGHSGDDGTGESHFQIVIRADAFAMMSRVQRHRAVFAALGDIPTRVHALGLDIG